MAFCIKCKMYSDQSNYRQLCMYCFLTKDDKNYTTE